MVPINCNAFNGGIVWSTGSIDEHETYRRLAFLPYKTLELRIGADCTDDLRPLVEAEAAAIREAASTRVEN